MNELFFGVANSGQFAYCLVVLAIAGFAQGMFGLGFAMIATPLLALVLDYRGAVFLAAVPLLFIAISYLAVQWRLVMSEPLSKAITPGLILGSFVGVWLQTSLPEYAALALLAILLAGSAALPVILQRWLALRQKSANASPTAFGAFAGLTDTALNVGAPFIVLYGGLNSLNSLQQLLALNLCFAIGKTIQVTITTTSMPIPIALNYLGWGVMISLVAYLAGANLNGRFSEIGFRRALNIFLYVMACVLGYRALAHWFS